LFMARAHMWLPLLLVALLVVSAVGLLSPGTSQPQRVVNLLMCTGLAISLATEFIVLNGDVGRMNTVFKLDFQVWALWSVACAVALWDVLTGLSAWQHRQQQIVGYGAALLLA